MATRKQSYRIKWFESHKRTHFNAMRAAAISTLRSPIVRIEDHSSEVLSCEFHPTGNFLLSSNSNGEVRVCDIYGTFPRSMVLKGHTGPVTEAHYSKDGFNIYSCSVDGTLSIWDSFRGYRTGRLVGHSAAVNCMQPARIGYTLLCSGSIDGTVKIWDAREKECALTFESGGIVTATCFSDSGEYVYAGGLEADIQIWDLRKREIVCNLRGHTGKVTGLSLSPCGSYLLSNSVDNTIRVWDVRPNVTFKRCVGNFPSSQQSTDGLLRCAWSPDGTMVSAGTSERDVYVWDVLTGETLHELAGHESSINDIAFHPKEPVILSASGDKYLFLHEMKKLI